MKIRRIGFSLMEMMVVLLIISIIAAATAPMVSKRMISTAKGDSPWVWSGVHGSIAYNLGSSDTATATIGHSFDDSGQHPRLYIKGNNEVPFITFRNGNNENHKINLLYNDNGSLSLSTIDPFEENSTLFGVDANIDTDASGATVVGNSAASFGKDSVALGRNAQCGSDGGVSQVAVGHLALAQGSRSVAIGGGDRKTLAAPPFQRLTRTVATGDSSIAIGYDVAANADFATAIGNAITGSAGAAQATVIGNNITGVTGSRSIVIGSDMILNNPSHLGNNNDITVIGPESSVRTCQNNRADGSVAIGKKASVFSSANTRYANNSIAIGTDAKAFGEKSSDENDVSGDNIAIGTGAYVLGRKSIAIGRSSNAFGFEAIAIGDSASTHYREKAIAIGCWTNSDGDNGKRSIAIGDNAQAKMDNAVAIGNNAAAKAKGSTAIGGIRDGVVDGNYATIAFHQNSTAIGAGAQTSSTNQVVIGTEWDTVYIPGTLYVPGTLKVANMSVRNSDGTYHTGNVKHGNNDYIGHGGYRALLLNVSDRRLKNVGEAFKGGLEEIKKLEVFNYTFKKDPQKTPRVGVIAQDLMKIFPNAVFKGEDGFYKIRMEDMFYALVNAVKELDSKITTNIKRINELEEQNAELVRQNVEQEKRIDNLEKRITELEKLAKQGK